MRDTFSRVPRQGRILIIGMSIISLSIIVVSYLFPLAPLAAASIFSITYAAVLFLRARADFQNYSPHIGYKLTYIILTALWVPTYYSALNILVMDGSGPTIATGRVIVSVLGIGLLEGLSLLESGVVIFALGVIFFQSADRISKAVWGVIDDIASD